jgi:Sulfotransferase family
MVFEHTRWREIVDDFLRRCHRELKVMLARPASPEKWLFLVGCYNSGTTLLAEVLGEHPLLGVLPEEGQYLTDQLLLDYAIGLPRMWVEREDLFRMTEDSKGPDVKRIRKEWAMRLRRRHAPVVVEKTPANMARTRWLQANFRDACFVGVIRDPYAVAAGIRKKAEPRHRAAGWPIEMCAHQWARSNLVLEEDAQKLERFMWARYEDFVEAPSRVLTAMLDLVGLPPWSRFEEGRSWKVHERNEPIQNLNAASIDELSSDDIRRINATIGDTIRHFGYELLPG